MDDGKDKAHFCMKKLEFAINCIRNCDYFTILDLHNNNNNNNYGSKKERELYLKM